MDYKIEKDENYLSDEEKQVIVDREIRKLLGDKPLYNPNELLPLSDSIIEQATGKFVHGVKQSLKLPDAAKKLKSARRRKIRSTVSPRKPRQIHSLLLEVTIMEFSNNEWVDSNVFGQEDEYSIIAIPGSQFRLKMSGQKLRAFLYKSLYNGNPGYVTFEKGKENFKMAVEINPQLLLDNDEATII